MSRATIKDYKGIAEALDKYVEGMVIGSSEVMKPSFYKGATMYGYALGFGLTDGSIQTLFDMVDQAGPNTNLKAKIDILGIDGTAASARVILENGAIYTDFMHLIKIDGEWKIISKIFHQHS